MEISYPALLIIALVSAFGLGIVAHIAWISRKPSPAKQPSSHQSEADHWQSTLGKSEKGSVFTVLMVGLGMAATLSIVTYQILSGPVASVARVTQHNLAKNQMITINRIALMDAVLQASNGDCDTDGYIEPRAWRTTTGAKPTNGGLLPLAMGAPTSDPWMSEYGYCVWDVGTLSAQAGCGGATGRLDGADNPVSGDAKTLSVMAVISSGPDRVFQTTCNAYVNATTDLISITAGSDDLVQRYTYAEAAAGGGGEGLWFLKSGDPNTAQIARNIEVGGGGIVQATAVNTTGKMVAGDGLRVGTDASVADIECDDANKGLMRYKSATNVVQFCAGTTLGWIDAGNSGGGASIDSLSDAITNLANLNLFLGETSGDSITTAKYNVAIGQNTLTSLTSGESNVAIGTHTWGNALDSLTTGNSNVAIGPYAMDGLTTASGNIAIGEGAGSGLTTGGSNVAIGGGSMIYMGGGATTNVAVGGQAMQGNGADAGYNAAVGVNALRRIETGNSNIAIGYEAGDHITTGGRNIAIGQWALSSQTTVDGNIAIGWQALGYNGAGTDNIAIGYDALLYNEVGNNNIALGREALRGSTTPANNTGANNTALGGFALRNYTSGSNNVAVGFNALLANTTGLENTAVGSQALAANTSGVDNVMVGFQAGDSITTGTQNVGIGNATLSSQTTESDNIGIGDDALTLNTAGSRMVAIGKDSLESNTTADDNTAVGYYTLRMNTGASNTAVGAEALDVNTTGSLNTAVGMDALGANINGTSNTAVGSRALISNTAGLENTAIGMGAMGLTTTGGYNTALGSNALYNNVTGSNNTAIGLYTLFANTGSSNVAVGGAVGSPISALGGNTTGSNNTAVGVAALVNNSSGNSNTAVGNSAGPSTANLSNTTAIGNSASVTASNTIRLGNASVTAITGQVDFTFPSDRRDKHDINDVDLGLDFVMGLRPVSYRLNNGSGRLDYGFIAQEVEASLAGRETNMITRQNDERGSYLFRSSDLLSPIVRAVQEQNARIDALGPPLPVPPMPLWLQLLFAGAALSVIYAAAYVVFTHPRQRPSREH